MNFTSIFKSSNKGHLKSIRNIIFFAFSLLLLQCSSERNYVAKALDIMQENSINTGRVNWDSLRRNSIGRAAEAQHGYESYGIIRDALETLDDNHSFLITQKVFYGIQTEEKDIPIIQSKIIGTGVAYLKVPGFTGTPNMAMEYAKDLQERIKELDKGNPRGWIIDLSQNSGGNMWPMLLGLGPILGDGCLGYFEDNKGVKIPWIYRDGKVFIGSDKVMGIENPYQLKNKDKKIGVLIGNTTASSGEATVIAFIGKRNVLLFGEVTYGLTTGNASYELSDGAMLMLTTTNFLDRNKKVYGDVIEPDRFTSEPIRDAMSWICKIPIN